MLNRMPHQPPRLPPGLPPGQASIVRPHQRRWPDEIAGHLPVAFPLSPFCGEALVQPQPAQLRPGRAFFVTEERLVGAEAALAPATRGRAPRISAVVGRPRAKARRDRERVM